MNSTVTIPPALGGCNAEIDVPVGSFCLRIEPILSDEDFNAGKPSDVKIEMILDGQVAHTYPLVTLKYDPVEDGNAPCVQLNGMTIDSSSGTQQIVHAAFEHESVRISVTCDEATKLGASVCFADAHENLPPKIRPNVGSR